MELFINSTFTHSMLGYRLLRLYSDGCFYDVESVDEIGAELFGFFSEELFKYVWFEKGDECYFCAKGIRGIFNNSKEGYIDIAVKADIDSLSGERITAIVLNNFSKASALVFACTTVTLDGDYTFDFDGFIDAFSSLPTGSLPAFVSREEEPNALKAGVCIGSANRAMEKMKSLGVTANKQHTIPLDQFEKMIC